jgi:hypothetical protein
MSPNLVESPHWHEVLPWPLINAASWRLAADLVAALPGARVVEMHPGGGQYDILAVLADDGGVRLQINRGGSLHFEAAPTAAAAVPPERLWPTCVRPGGARLMATDALQASGLQGRPRNRSRRRLECQVISHVLTARAFEQEPWDVRSAFDDSSGSAGSSVVRNRLPPDGLMPRSATPAETWAVLQGNSPRAWLHDGWLGLPTGERRDLKLLRDRGWSLPALAALAA